MQLTLAGLLAALPAAAALVLSRASQHAGGSGKVGEVVDLLNDMLSESKTDAETERGLYAKFKCYCDENKKARTSNAERLTEEVALLQGAVEETLGATAAMSTEVGLLSKDLSENEASAGKAASLRENEHIAFSSEKSDLEVSIGAVWKALKEFVDIKADQTESSGADHTEYMGNRGASFLDVGLLQRLSALATLAGEERGSKLAAFVQERQAPGGAYGAQSGGVVGILKGMRKGFKEDLAAKADAENKSASSFVSYTSLQDEAHRSMDATRTSKQGTLGSMDAKLGAIRGQLRNAKQELQDDNAFVLELKDTCRKKEKQYSERVDMRQTEDTAISEAIAILSKDAASVAFGAVNAKACNWQCYLDRYADLQGEFGSTNTAAAKTHYDEHGKAEGRDCTCPQVPFLLQLGRAAQQAGELAPRMQVQRAVAAMLQKRRSPALLKTLVLLSTGSPLGKVLKMLGKVRGNLDTEEKSEEEQHDLCVVEASNIGGEAAKTQEEIDRLTGEKNGWTALVEAPVSGLRDELSLAEEELGGIQGDQNKVTVARREGNVEYVQHASNLVKAEEALGAAIGVLGRYYAQLELVQGASGTPTSPPSTWNEEYAGQSGKANTVIALLQSIVADTRAEEESAHTDEVAAQHDFEDLQEFLKGEEARRLRAIADLHGDLANSKAQMSKVRKQLRAVEAEKEELDKYEDSIKPGCEYITKNFAARSDQRGEEKHSIAEVMTVIKESPEFQTTKLVKKKKGFGACADPCEKQGEGWVSCKACLNKVSIPGWCTNHPDTDGCAAWLTMLR